MIRSYSVYDSDFIEVLDAFPEGLATVRGYLLGGFGILVGIVPVHEVWRAIVLDRGEEEAADVVAELVITKGGPRVNELIARAAAGEDLYLRADDPKLARILFHGEGEWDRPEIGDYVVDYYERSRPFLHDEDTEEDDAEDDEWQEDDEDEGEEEEGERVDVDLNALFSGKPRPSALENASWSLERIQTPSRGYLTVPASWLEADLEKFLWLNWEKIDLGLDRPLHLVGRQQRLRSGTSDRVDLLARGSGGEWVAIELKIGEASIRALGQLISYMADLERGGKDRNKVRGILVAASFSAKALNAAAADPRVTLLRFAVRE